MIAVRGIDPFGYRKSIVSLQFFGLWSVTQSPFPLIPKNALIVVPPYNPRLVTS
jgi:hypothetical protein